MENNDFYNKIADDVKQVLIQFLSEAGHGKTSSLKTIIQHCQSKHQDLAFKIFDVSVAWWHTAPVKYRQDITDHSIDTANWENIEDCVYDISEIGKDLRRAFIGTIMKQDYDKRIWLAKHDPEQLKNMPYIIYVIEEANICFGPYALRTNDMYTPVFQQFVSVGRNLKLRGFLVATAEVGEISPSLRDKSRRIYGKLESERDLKRIRQKDKELSKYLSSEIPKYHFVYYSGESYHSEKIPDSVTNTPSDYKVDRVEVNVATDKNGFNMMKYWRYYVTFLVAYTLGWLLSYSP